MARINNHSKRTGDAHIGVTFRGTVVARVWSESAAKRAEEFLAKVPDDAEPDWAALRQEVFGV